MITIERLKEVLSYDLCPLSIGCLTGVSGVLVYSRHLRGKGVFLKRVPRSTFTGIRDEADMDTTKVYRFKVDIVQ